MVCHSCKKEIADESLYCPNCGTRSALSANANQVPDDASQVPASASQVPAGASQVPANATQVPVTEAEKPKRQPVSNLTIFLIAFFSTLVISAIVFAILGFNGVFDDKDDGTNNPVVQDDADSGENVNTDEGILYDYKYSYAELSDVLSLDSDPRFVYSSGYTEEGVSVYTYLFYDDKATDAEFYRACDDYSILLQEENGFTYDKEYSEQQYEETGDLANYLSRDDDGIIITASIEDSLKYAYITIFRISDVTPTEDSQADYSMPNYDKYLAGRDISYFTYEETVSMENGLSFYIYDVIANYPGDGTMQINISMDLSSWYTDYYMNNGDFMVLPVDADGNILSDAIPASSVTDGAGSNVAMPFLVSATSYEYYTFTYDVPANTSAFSIYAANVLSDDMSGPVYVMDVGY